MRFYKDGYDYISNDGKFEITNEYGLWRVYIDGEKSKCFAYLKEAKEFCKNYAK